MQVAHAAPPFPTPRSEYLSFLWTLFYCERKWKCETCRLSLTWPEQRWRRSQMGHGGFSPVQAVRQPSVKFQTCFIFLAPLLNLSFTPNVSNNCDIRTLLGIRKLRHILNLGFCKKALSWEDQSNNLLPLFLPVAFNQGRIFLPTFLLEGIWILSLNH